MVSGLLVMLGLIEQLLDAPARPGAPIGRAGDGPGGLADRQGVQSTGGRLSTGHRDGASQCDLTGRSADAVTTRVAADQRPSRPAGSSAPRGWATVPSTRSRAAGAACDARPPTAGACCACGRSGAARARSALPSSATSRTGPNLVTMAMNGWADPEPAWWLNLQAHPDATVDLVDGSRARPRTRRGQGRAAPPVGQVGRLRQEARRLRRPAIAADRGRHPVAPTRIEVLTGAGAASG